MAEGIVMAGSYVHQCTPKGQDVFRIWIDMPIAHGSEFIRKFGMPLPGRDIRVAVALLQSVPDRNSSDADKAAYTDTTQRESGKRWADLSRAQRAGILCADPQFQKWANMPDSDVTASWLRSICKVTSRSDIDNNTAASDAFDAIVAQFRTATGQETERR